MNNVMAIDIGSTQFRVGLFDQEGRRLLVLEGGTQPQQGREWMLEQLRLRCQELLQTTDHPVKACGVSFGGLVDFARQTVRSHHSPGWEDFVLSRWVEETTGLPCHTDNDANAGALGEWRFGAARGAHSIFFIAISTGVGGGLLLDGKIHRGKDSLAGEIGHTPVSDSGVTCTCGARGCLETFCSGSAIALRGREWAERRPERASRMLELSGGDTSSITAQAVAQAAAEGDSMAQGIIHESARWLGRTILTLIRTINPDKIVLGGGVAGAGELLLGPVRESLQDFASPTVGYSTEIVLAGLGNYSPLYGAAAMAIDLLA